MVRQRVQWGNMAIVDVSIRFAWQATGPVTLDGNGKLSFPKTSHGPGLYRMEIAGGNDTMIYIGEADQLSRRLQHYRTPGPSQRTNLRLNALMCETLANHGTISLAVVTEAVTLRRAGSHHPLNLNSKSERVLLEHAALLEAKASGAHCLNL